PGSSGDVLECAVPTVAKEPIGFAVVALRPAEVRSTARRATRPVIGEAEVDVVDHEQIEPAVGVEIRKRGAGGPTRIIDTGNSGRLDETDHSRAAQVSPQLVCPEVAEVQI